MSLPPDLTTTTALGLRHACETRISQGVPPSMSIGSNEWARCQTVAEMQKKI